MNEPIEEQHFYSLSTGVHETRSDMFEALRSRDSSVCADPGCANLRSTEVHRHHRPG